MEPTRTQALGLRDWFEIKMFVMNKLLEALRNDRHSFDVKLSFGRQLRLFSVGVFPSLMTSLQTSA
jgi:hypothetical protein